MIPFNHSSIENEERIITVPGVHIWYPTCNKNKHCKIEIKIKMCGMGSWTQNTKITQDDPGVDQVKKEDMLYAMHERSVGLR